MTERPDVGRALTAAARTMNEPATLADTLQRIVDAARDSVPGFDEVGIATVDKKGVVHTRAATGQLVHTLDDLQYSLDEGPCVDSLLDDVVVAAPRVSTEERWPRYLPKAIEHGLRAQMAVKMHLADGVTGTLNFYSTQSEEIDPSAGTIADLFATHAAIALGHANQRENLNEALQSRRVIGQALGILMERYQISEDRAFSFLLRASSHSNIKVRDIAQELVETLAAR